MATALLYGVAASSALLIGASLTLLIAIFASNLPEALVGAVAMRQEERSTKAVLGI